MTAEDAFLTSLRIGAALALRRQEPADHRGRGRAPSADGRRRRKQAGEIRREQPASRASPARHSLVAIALELSRASDGALAVAGGGTRRRLAGALYWPEQGLLAVADLHLEKGSSFAERGVLLPPYDTAATLARLARADRALCAARGGRARRQLPRRPRPGAARRHRPRHAERPAARPRLGLDRRQSRSRAGRGHRRALPAGSRSAR